MRTAAEFFFYYSVQLWGAPSPIARVSLETGHPPSPWRSGPGTAVFRLLLLWGHFSLPQSSSSPLLTSVISPFLKFPSTAFSIYFLWGP